MLLKWIGYDNGLSYREKYTYVVHSTAFLAMLFFLSMYLYVIKIPIITLISASYIFVMLFIFRLLKLKFFTLSKALILGLLLFQESLVAFWWFGNQANFSLYFFLIAPSSYFILDFDNRNERIIMLSANLAAIALFVLATLNNTMVPLYEFSHTMVLLFTIVNALFTIALINLVYHFYSTTLNTANKSLNHLANTDSLTNLYNRRVLFSKGEATFNCKMGLKDKSALILFDIDHFKHINDAYGHPVGDIILVEISRIISLYLSNRDTFCRYGGEEFAILTHDKTVVEAKLLAEAILLLIRNHPFKIDDYKTIHLTISVGVTHGSNTYENFESMVKSCDRALYTAKEKGRNRLYSA